MTTARSYYQLNRLTGINSIPAAANQLPLSFQYSYNDANQRIRVGLHDGSYWLYEYDALGQVKSGKRYWSDGTPVAGQQYEYAHDDIGNRTETKAGGDSTGGNLRTATYGANSLNQYTNRAVPGYVDVLGVATSGSAVTVNGTGAYRRGEYFHVALAVDNRSGPQYPSIVIQAVAGANSASSTGSVFLAKTPETFVHDADGNLTQDGRWTYTWDRENRLVAMEALSAVPAAAKLRVEFEYDWRGRRIGKTVKAWSGTSYTNVYVLKFLYDGWNLVAELDTNNAVVRSYLWGTDLSGSYQGAGGGGGLLAVNVATNGVHFPAHDGNGNVAGLVSASNGAVTARFEYGPFAEPIRVSGPIAKAVPLRFSTKYLDGETGLYYYGYRYCDPSTGRWLSRDPIEELDGPNLYEASYNNPLSYVDRNGLDNWSNPSAGQNAPPVFIFPPASFLPVSGDFTFTVTDAAHHTAIGSIVVGIEMTRTGELRLQYDRLAQELKRLGLSDEAAKAARTALQEEFRNKGPALFRAWTQKILEERARIGHQNLKDNPFKTNAKLNARAKVLSGAGRAVAVLGFAVEAYNLYQTPADELPSQAAKAGGRLGGGFIGGAGAGALGGSWGGPWGAAVGALIGGVAGSIAGEGVVEACVEKK